MNIHATSEEMRLKHRLEALRAVATVEWVKGVAVMLAGFGVLSLMHRDVWGVADSLLRFLHVNPERHFAQVFLDWADNVTDTELLKVAALAGAYSTLRFIEGYGLWFNRAWGQWVALVSGSLYIPFEVHDLLLKATPIRAAVLIINLGIVYYMAYLRVTDRRDHGAQSLPAVE